MKDRNFLAELLLRQSPQPMATPQPVLPVGGVAPEQEQLATPQKLTPISVLDSRQALADSLLKQAADRSVHPIARGLAAYLGTKQSKEIETERAATEAEMLRKAELEKEYKRQMDERLFGLKERETAATERQVNISGKKADAEISLQERLFGLKQEELDLEKKKLELSALQKIEENKAKLTPGQEALDKEFAKNYAEYKAQGGYADVQKSLDQLRSARDDLTAAQDDPEGGVSGSRIGITPDFILAAVNPKAVDTREKIQEVAQRNLRLVLGAQFTEKEGERLINRVYNPKLEESANAERLDRLFKQIDLAAQVREDASNYFEQNGTLKGWQGKMPTISDFEPPEDKNPTKESDGVINWQELFK